MNLPTKSFPTLLLLVALAVLLSAGPALAGTSPPEASSAGPLFGGLTDYVMGNRSRMIQIATIAFGIGLVILMTATRKH